MTDTAKSTRPFPEKITAVLDAQHDRDGNERFYFSTAMNGLRGEFDVQLIGPRFFAHLLKEAEDVNHETSLTPRQLLDENRILTARLEKIETERNALAGLVEKMNNYKTTWKLNGDLVLAPKGTKDVYGQEEYKVIARIPFADAETRQKYVRLILNAPLLLQILKEMTLPSWEEMRELDKLPYDGHTLETHPFEDIVIADVIQLINFIDGVTESGLAKHGEGV